MSALSRIYSLSRTKCKPLSVLVSSRNISTSKKKQETATVDTTIATAQTTTKVQNQNWMSYGYDFEDKNVDRHFMHATMFMGISVIFVFGGMLLAYRPDDLDRDWAQREGFLALRRREKLGLPLVDPNYLPLDQIILPTDEELGDTEIVV